MSTPPERPPRRPFEDAAAPQPFYETAEFRRALVLMGVLLLFGIIAFFVNSMRTAQLAEDARTKANRDAAKALMPQHLLTPEEREARRLALFAKLEGALADSENGDPLLQQTNGYRKLLEVMQRYSHEDLVQRAKIDFDFALVMEDPDAWRGEFLRVRGILHKIWAVRLDRPILGQPDVFHAMMDTGDDPFFVDLLERSPDVDDGEALDTEAVFYRTVKYEAANGVKREAPLFVAKSLRRVPAAIESGWRLFLREHSVILFASLAFLVFGGALLLSVIRRGRKPVRRSSATPRSFEHLFDQELRAEGKLPPRRNQPPH